MSEFRNIKMVITYAREILKAQGGHYPEVEALISQAEMDVQHFEWELEYLRGAGQHRLQRDELPRTAKAAFPARNIFSRLFGWFSATRR